MASRVSLLFLGKKQNDVAYVSWFSKLGGRSIT
jgi:hypothetical protein